MQVDRTTLLAKLRNDPSLKYNEGGRRTLNWLHHHTVDPESVESVGVILPDHWVAVVADLARTCAAAWTMLAEELEQRADTDTG